MRNSVIFDMDGILFDSERLFTLAWYKIGDKMGLQDITTCVTQCIGRNGKDTRAFLQDKFGPSFSYETFIGEVKQEFEVLASAEGGLPLKPGVREILTWLQETGVKIGLATSTSQKSAVRHLDEAGLLGFFNTVVTGDMIRNGKPDPEIYKLACEKLGVAPQQCYAIEDSPNGIISAHAAGLKVIMVPDQIAPSPEIEKLLYKKFDSLQDVKTYFDSLKN